VQGEESPLDPTGEASGFRLVTADGGSLRRDLVRCLENADFDCIDLLVSFVMLSGIELIGPRLDDALQRGASIRLLTTDYLGITDVAALGFLLDRLGENEAGGSLKVRVFSSGHRSFHPKAYLFESSTSNDSRGFVGSSNLSRSGLVNGVEWNVALDGVGELSQEFARLWVLPESRPLTALWLHEYERRRAAARQADAIPGAELPPEIEVQAEAPRPWSVQQEALTALESTRAEGQRAGLVVMATGLGKTWLAAFDSTRPQFKRTLFVAHREEILTQARDVFRRVRTSGELTMFTGAEREPGGSVVFSMVQSLTRNLDAFVPGDFDYVVVDEFHHAAAPTYRRVLNYFKPAFLLGLTATPERTDQADLLALCGDNLVYECGLVEGVQRRLLCGFTYRAIKDVADYEHIPWRNGRFDPEVLTKEVATLARAAQVFDEWTRMGGPDRRSLAFCCSIAHAEFMNRYFNDRGVVAAAVHSEPTSANRGDALAALEEGDLSVVFAVDLFNEGIDVPEVDSVLMLRPTESPVIFLQQLGRGLRQMEGKHLEVIDLVGNHRAFLVKARMLAALVGHPEFGTLKALQVLKSLGDGPDNLPEGCSIIVETEVVEMLQQLVPASAHKDLEFDELVDQWVEEHGRRPTALEMSLWYGKALRTKRSAGGWFGLLQRLSHLSSEEEAAFHEGADYLLSMEFGGLSKIHELMTLQSLADAGALRTRIRLRDLSQACRWAILGNPYLREEAIGQAASFDSDAGDWDAAWQELGVAELTSRRRPWFELIGEDLVSKIEIPESCGEAFDWLAAELLEYRLHRFLRRRELRRTGNTYKILDREGEELDASVTVEVEEGRPVAVVVESAGGPTKGAPPRNPDYVKGLDMLLERIRESGLEIRDIYLDTARTTHLSIAERRLAPQGHTCPIDLRGVELIAFRNLLLQSMANTARTSNAKGGGNRRKRFRIVPGGLPNFSPEAVADALVRGGRRLELREVADTSGWPEDGAHLSVS